MTGIELIPVALRHIMLRRCTIIIVRPHTSGWGIVQDYTDDLAAVENALRRIVDRVGRDLHGAEWAAAFGISPSVLDRWRRNQARELDRRGAGIAEDRLIYFSDFGDLEQIILGQWASFEPVFLDRERTAVYLRKLRELRNPDAHRRALTATEKALITGMAGELRTQVTRYLSQRDTPDEFFPRLDSLRDNLGNAFGHGGRRPVIRVGDVLEFVAEGWDPEGAQLEYHWTTSPGATPPMQDWSPLNRFVWEVRPDQVANPAWLNCAMRGPREPHAEGTRDVGWSIAYTVLPRRG